MGDAYVDRYQASNAFDMKIRNDTSKEVSAELKLKEKLMSRALKSEKDIQDGKLHDRKEIERRLQTSFDR